MEIMFAVVPFFVTIIFVVVIGTFIATFVKSIQQNHRDNVSPRITADATVVTRRTKVWGDHSRTVYYVTFQFESGDRLELQIPHDRFGYLVEGDVGKLTFQGTRFLGFERI